MARAPVHIALLRGINVGGKNRLPMAELRGLFEAAGCSDVRTFIQSGNVLFRAGRDVVRRVPRVVARAIEAELGLRVPLVLRTSEELEETVDDNPFAAGAADPKALHVVFLADRPTPARAARLDPDRSPPDEFVLRGREIYLRCPRGVARTKLTNAWFDAQLDTVSTVRNWQTVQQLVALARADQGA
jgi:uncharacterized protein (DUF1697 family)